MKFANAILIMLTLCLALPVQADVLENKAANRKALMMGLYPPDLIMKHQEQLQITNEQRRNITDAVKQFQSEVADLQWDLQAEQQKLQKALSGHPIASNESLAQVDQVLTLETEFKKAHFRLLIAIKNVLTQAQIDEIDAAVKRKRATQQKGR